MKKSTAILSLLLVIFLILGYWYFTESARKKEIAEGKRIYEEETRKIYQGLIPYEGKIAAINDNLVVFDGEDGTTSTYQIAEEYSCQQIGKPKGTCGADIGINPQCVHKCELAEIKPEKSLASEIRVNTENKIVEIIVYYIAR